MKHPLLAAPAAALAVALFCVSAAAADSPAYTVRWQGSLRAVHGGDVAGKVPLPPFAGRQNLYAVGPVADMDGELTAMAGKIYIARVQDGDVKTSGTLPASASFLVWADVAAWKPPVPLGVIAPTHAQLEKRIEALAASAGIDTSQPFPFKLEGNLASVDYHVVVPKPSSSSPGGHSDGAKNLSAKNVEAEVIGFFSKHHEGVFTHRGSFAHLHVVERNGHSGHVDEISAGAEVRVSFPQ